MNQVKIEQYITGEEKKQKIEEREKRIIRRVNQQEEIKIIKKNRMERLQQHFSYEEIPEDISYIYLSISQRNESYYMMIDKEVKSTIIREMMCEWYHKPERNYWKKCIEEYSKEENKSRQLRHEFLQIDDIL